MIDRGQSRPVDGRVVRVVGSFCPQALGYLLWPVAVGIWAVCLSDGSVSSFTERELRGSTVAAWRQAVTACNAPARGAAGVTFAGRSPTGADGEPWSPPGGVDEVHGRVSGQEHVRLTSPPSASVPPSPNSLQHGYPGFKPVNGGDPKAGIGRRETLPLDFSSRADDHASMMAERDSAIS